MNKCNNKGFTDNIKLVSKAFIKKPYLLKPFKFQTWFRNAVQKVEF